MSYSNHSVKYKISSKINIKNSWLEVYNKFKLLFLMFVSIALLFYIPYLVVFKNLNDVYEETIAKVYNHTNNITDFIRTKKNNTLAYINIKKRYDALEKENEILNQQLILHKNVLAENEELKKLTKFSLQENKVIKSTKIIMKSIDKYVEFALIPLGYSDGIRKDQAIVDRFSIIGKVVEVGEKSSKILLITSLDSQVPVIFTKASNRAMLSGYYNGKLVVTILNGDKSPELGELVVTSGDGNSFPPGLAVGEVTRIKEDFIEITPTFNPTAINIVSVMEKNL